MVAFVARRRDHDRKQEHHRIQAMQAMAALVRASHQTELEQVSARIDARLLRLEPLRQTWNVFRLFGIEYAETRWTQWFAAILRSENGPRCARVAWAAFCEAIAHRAQASPPSGDERLAEHRHWLDVVANEVPQVEDEVGDGELGRLDLLFTTPTVVAAVENKLWADWHDGSGPLTQAERYRQIAHNRLDGDPVRRLGLVLLSQKEGLLHHEHYPSDYIHVSWRDVGQALRRALGRESLDQPESVLELWPIVLTLVSIEQDLLGLSITPPATASRSARLSALSKLASYLEGT